MSKTKIKQLLNFCRAHRSEFWGVLLGCAIACTIMIGHAFKHDQASLTATTLENIPQPPEEKTSSRNIERRMNPVPIEQPREEPHPAATEQTSVPPSASFPPLLHTQMVVRSTPKWGTFRTPAEWNRRYGEFSRGEFERVPAYDLTKLTIPMAELAGNLSDENMAIITQKLFYSTRFHGSYDIDAGENTGSHTGIDLKLALDTPIGAIAGGRVHAIRTNEKFGLHVFLEHRLKDGTTFYSLYGHLATTLVQIGESVSPGTTIGTVGGTGETSGPHVHLQVDRILGDADRYPLGALPTDTELDAWAVNPIQFIETYTQR